MKHDADYRVTISKHEVIAALKTAYDRDLLIQSMPQPRDLIVTVQGDGSLQIKWTRQRND